MNRKAILLASILLMGFWLLRCAGSPPEIRQGITGKFISYHYPAQEPCEKKYPTQEERDRCNQLNRSRIEEAMQGKVVITRMDNQVRQEFILDEKGGYKAPLKPAYYTVCLEEKCSDAIEVRLNRFITWGGEFPQNVDSTAMLDTVKNSVDSIPQDSVPTPQNP